MKKSLQNAKEKRRWQKNEWIELWIARAHAANAIKKCSLLEVDSGEIIYATRDFKPLSFHNTLKKQVGKDLAYRVNIDPVSGGWRKFARENLSRKDKKGILNERPELKHDACPQMMKGEAGWLTSGKNV